MKYIFILTTVLLTGITLTQAQDSIKNTWALCWSALGNSSDPSMHLLYEAPVTGRELRQDCRHLSLDIDAAGFFFDAEYATPMAKGYSVTGFRLSPTLRYGINEKAQLRVGFNATAFAGLDSLYRLRPSLSLIYAPAEWITLVAGTLFGNNTHQLYAAVYDPVRWVYDYTEEGLQILTRTSWWNSDTWLDWSHYLTPWTADQERFTMGTSHLFRIVHLQPMVRVWNGCNPELYNQLGWQINLPFHFMASHRGGEVKTLDTNTVTTFNERIGLQARYAFTNALRGSLHSLKLDVSLYNYHLEDKSLDHGGRALYPTLSYEWLHWNPHHSSHLSVRAIAGYWHGDHYFSAYGSPCFWSVNAYSALHMPTGAALVEADLRNLLTFSVDFEHEYRKLNLGLQFGVLYDMDLHKTDLLVGFVMRYKERFLML